MVRGDLFDGESGTEEVHTSSAAEFSVTGCGDGGVGNPCVTGFEGGESAGARVVDENGRPTVQTRGREKEVYPRRQLRAGK
jgi:hypothetical protein